VIKLNNGSRRYRRGGSEWVHLALHLLRMAIELLKWFDDDGHGWW
jgi:hypothetical protein